MMNDREFEESLKGIFEENIEENSSAEFDIDKLLESAYKEAEKEKKKNDKIIRKQKRVRRIRAAVIFFGIIIASLVVFGPEQGYADIFRFMMDRVGTYGNVVQDNFIGDESENESIVNNIIDIEELDKEVGFHVVIPEYLKENFEILDEIQITKSKNEIISISIQYINYNSDEYIFYSITNLEQKRCNTSIMDVPEGTGEIIKNSENIDYYYYFYEDNKTGRVYWENDEYLYYFQGDIDKAEAIDIVESLI